MTWNFCVVAIVLFTSDMCVGCAALFSMYREKDLSCKVSGLAVEQKVTK